MHDDTHATPVTWLGWRDSFLEMMVATRGASLATRDSYSRDLADFFSYASANRLSMETMGYLLHHASQIATSSSAVFSVLSNV